MFHQHATKFPGAGETSSEPKGERGGGGGGRNGEGQASGTRPLTPRPLRDREGGGERYSLAACLP